MANTDNKCSTLGVVLEESKDFDKIFGMQKELQKRIGCDFENMSLDDIAKFWFANRHAMSDEISEMMDALGGIDDGIGNAAWKWWKKDNIKAKEMNIDSLSKNDLKELKFEVVDMFHFAINFAVSIGLTGSEMYSMYMSKNQENFDRQERGY